MEKNTPDELQILKKLDAVAAEFEAAFSTGGSRDSIESLLECHSDSNLPTDRLLKELVQLEIELRGRAGELPTSEEYHARFPELDIDWVVKTIERIPIADTVDQAVVSGFDVGDTQSLHQGRGTDYQVGLSTFPNAGKSKDSKLLPNALAAIGDYEILSEIARGGMGVVYKARQKSLNRTVALKMIITGQLAGGEEVKRFRSEAEAAANLDHPGIVPIYEISEHDGHQFFSMGFVDGESLQAKLADGPLQPRLAADLTRKIALAISFAHDNGVIHRDLKPANILIDKQGEPKVSDFGLAKQVESDSNLTRTGAVMGTPSFMPPEQAAGQTDAIDTRVDIYSLSAILYSLLTGRPPFQAANVVETLKQVLHQDPIPPRSLNNNVDRDLDTICQKGLSKDPNRRYASSSEFASDLQRFLDGQPVLAQRPTWRYYAAKYAKRYRLGISIAASIIFLAILGVVLAFVRIQSEVNNKQSALAESQRRLALNHFQLGGQRADLNLVDEGLPEMVTAYKILSADDPMRDQFAEIINNRLKRLGPLLVHPHTVHSYGFCDDGSRMLTVGQLGQLTLWDVNTGEKISEIETLAEDFSPLRNNFRIQLNADGTRLVFRPDEGVRVYDTRTWKKLDEHPWPIDELSQRWLYDFVVSQDGNSIYLLDKQSKKVTHWSVGEKTNSRRFELKKDGRILTVSPSGKLIVCFESGNLQAYSMETGKPVFKPISVEVSDQNLPYFELMFSLSEELIFGMKYSRPWIWHLADNKKFELFEGLDSSRIYSIRNLSAIGINHDQTWVCTVSERGIEAFVCGEIEAMRLAGPQEVAPPPADPGGSPGDEPKTVSSDQNSLPTAARTVWNLGSLPAGYIPIGIRTDFKERADIGTSLFDDRLILSPTASHVATRIGMDTIRLQQFGTSGEMGQRIGNLAYFQGDTRPRFLFSDDDSLLVARSISTREPKAWRTEDFSQVSDSELENWTNGIPLSWSGRKIAFDGHHFAAPRVTLQKSDSTWDIAHSADGKYSWGVSDQYLLSCWDSEGHEVFSESLGHIFSWDVNKRMPSCVILRDNEFNSLESWLYRLDSVSQSNSGPVKLGESDRHVRFSPDGKLIAVCNNENVVRLLDANDGQPTDTRIPHNSNVTYLGFSSSGDTLICGCMDGKIYLWDTTHWFAKSFPYQTPGSVAEVAISHNGKHMVARTGAIGGPKGISDLVVRWNLPAKNPTSPVAQTERKTRRRSFADGRMETLSFEEWEKTDGKVELKK